MVDSVRLEEKQRGQATRRYDWANETVVRQNLGKG